MDAGGISVTRALAIDAALLGDVLVRLRRDTPGAVARWTLGNRGVAELDADFFPMLSASRASSPAWNSTARLWDTDGVALVHVVIEVYAVAVDTCELVVRPQLPLTPWWTARLPALVDLASATLDELGEELLFHATRDDIAIRSEG